MRGIKPSRIFGLYMDVFPWGLKRIELSASQFTDTGIPAKAGRFAARGNETAHRCNS
jgi:hypothetical protein